MLHAAGMSLPLRDWLHWKPTEAVRLLQSTGSPSQIARTRTKYVLGWGAATVGCGTTAALLFAGVLEGGAALASVGVGGAVAAAYLTAWAFRFIR
jgi:hypothetical protein